MDESEHAELRAILAEQADLKARLERLDLRTASLRDRLHARSFQAATPPPIAPEPPQFSAPVVPPILPQRTAPPPLPASAEVAPPKPAPSVAIETPSEPRSFELQLGTVWLVRIGIVVLLTGLVFLGNYAWTNIVARIGPLAKILFLYAIGIGLTGLGAWIERGRETLRNYARVLTAGGLATIYYTTYAAHFVPRLRVIESPLVAGVLLLAIAAAIVSLADRKKSQTLAIFAVLLSYYTSAINPLTSFTLFSNLLLTAAAVFLMARHRWVTLSFAALVASYLSYAYWQFFHGPEWGVRLRMTPGAFWTGAAFLTGYWTLFTAAVFLGRDDALARQRRLTFLSFNNAAYFGLVSVTLPGVYPGQFWLFAIGLGAVLLALAALARVRLREDPWTDGGYLFQGLLLVSIGIISKVTGHQLALALAAESAVLIACSRQRHGWIFLTIAGWAAAGAAGCALYDFEKHPAHVLPLGLTVVLILLFDARWMKHLAGNVPPFQWRAAWFTLLALGVGAGVIGEQVADANHSVVFAATAALLAFSTGLHGLVELALLGQIYLGVALSQDAPEWWRPLLVLAATVSMNDWWLRQKHLPLGDGFRTAIRVVYVAGSLAIFLPWTFDYLPERWQLLFLTGVSLGLLGWGLHSRNGLRLAVSAGLVIVGLGVFFFDPEARARDAWQDLLAIGLLLGAQQFGRRLSADPAAFPRGAQNAIIVTGVFFLWLWVTRWVIGGENAFYTTVAWSVLAAAIFATGLALRERTYRLAGLALLGLALGRIVFIDVWQLQTLYRILSFLVLGVVLLGLGFVYNKYAARFREWL